LVFILYAILGFWDLLSIILFLPIVVLDMMLGPFMILLFVVSAVLLGDYFYDLMFSTRGFVSKSEVGYMILGLVVFVTSFLILRWRFSDDPDKVLDLGVDYIHGLRDKIRQAIQWCRAV
jgi:hypothetical protein